MRYYWIAVGILFAPLPLSMVFGMIGQLFGCQNAFEVGCDPGLGNMFGTGGFILVFLTFFTLPFGVFFGLLGLIIKFVRDRKNTAVK